jgi:hypothetical protein
MSKMKEYQYDITLSVSVEADNELEAKGKAISKFIDKYGKEAYDNAFAFDLFDTIEIPTPEKTINDIKREQEESNE